MSQAIPDDEPQIVLRGAAAVQFARLMLWNGKLRKNSAIGPASALKELRELIKILDAQGIAFEEYT